jgi:hypothetical protein
VKREGRQSKGGRERKVKRMGKGSEEREEEKRG